MALTNVGCGMPKPGRSLQGSSALNTHSLSSADQIKINRLILSTSTSWTGTHHITIHRDITA